MRWPGMYTAIPGSPKGRHMGWGVGIKQEANFFLGGTSITTTRWFKAPSLCYPG